MQEFSNSWKTKIVSIINKYNENLNESIIYYINYISSDLEKYKDKEEEKEDINI